MHELGFRKITEEGLRGRLPATCKFNVAKFADSGTDSEGRSSICKVCWRRPVTVGQKKVELRSNGSPYVLPL